MKRSKTYSRKTLSEDRQRFARPANHVRRRAETFTLECLEERTLLTQFQVMGTNPAVGSILSAPVKALGVTSDITGLQPVLPLGSLVYEGTSNGVLADGSDVNTYNLAIDPHQTIAVVVTPVTPSMTATVTLISPAGHVIGTATSPAPGKPAVLDGTQSAMGGTYQFQVSGGPGQYMIEPVLNAYLDPAAYGGAPHNSIATATPIDPYANAFIGHDDRTAVVFEAALPQSPVYSLALNQGESASVALESLDGKNGAFTLYDDQGNVLASSVAGATNYTAGLNNFVAKVAGTYYVQVTGADQFNLVVTRGADFTTQDHTTPATAQNITATQQSGDSQQGGALGYLRDPTAGIGTDYYAVDANAGDNLHFATSTPAGGPAEFANNFSPELLLYDPNGNLVAVAAGNASDGRNSVIDFTVPSGDAGSWTIEVTASPNTPAPTQGEYGLLVTGATGAQAPFVVTSTNPPAGALIAPPTDLIVTFNAPVYGPSLTAGELEINGVPATAVTVVNGNTVDWKLDPASFAVGVDLPNVATIGADSLGDQVEDVSGVTLTPYSFTFFTTELHANLRSAKIAYGTSTGTFTGTLAAGGTPATGNLVSVLTTNVKALGVTSNITGLQPVLPLGSLVYEGTSDGVLTDVSDVDTYNLNIDPHQTIAVVVTPVTPSMTATVTLISPAGHVIGTATSPAPGKPAVLDGTQSLLGGTYQFQVSGGPGQYMIQPVLNAYLDPAAYGGAPHNSIATATPIDPYANAFIGHDDRTAVVFEAALPQSPVYSFALNQGESASVALESLDGKNGAFTLYDDQGNVLASSVPGATNYTAGLNNFVANVAGTYYVQVTGDLFNLVVTRGADFTTQDHTTLATAQGITATEQSGDSQQGGALGYLQNPTAGIGTDYYAVDANAGDNLHFATSTPAGGPAEFANNFSPELLLYDPNGNLVAVAAGNASDGRNSVIDFTVPSGDAGSWTIEVTASPNTPAPTQGEYGLLVTGATGAQAPFVVTSTNPPAGALIAPPTDLIVTFNAPVYGPSLTAGELEINGVPATAVTVVNGNTVDWKLDPASFAVGVDLPNVATIGADSLGDQVEDVSGVTLTPYSFTFFTTELQPAFANLSSAKITYGTPTVTFTGTLAASGTPATGSVTVTISGNGITPLSQSAPLDSSGHFTATFNTATLPAKASPYTVTYSYAAQGNFLAASDSSTTLTVVPAVMITGPTTGVAGQPLTYTFTAAESATSVPFTFLVFWGDSPTPQSYGPATSVTVTHTYATTGTFTIQVTATDAQHLMSAPATQMVTISNVDLQPDPFAPGKTALVIGGTTGNDTIMIRPSGSGIVVVLDGVTYGPFFPTGPDIIIAASTGYNQVIVSGAPAVVDKFHADNCTVYLNRIGVVPSGTQILTGGLINTAMTTSVATTITPLVVVPEPKVVSASKIVERLGVN